MVFSSFSAEFIPAIEQQLKKVIDLARQEGLEELYEMLTYHMGWSGAGAGPEATGKRIRPQLLLLVAEACGGNWRDAQPAAAAVELLHNFSLIHDDIEDNSPLRRGRETLWHKWGIPLAINCGDTMFTLALLSLQEFPSDAITAQTTDVLLRTSLHLTQGQHLDISYETKDNLPETAYWQMIGGKTAALIATCCELGALLGGAELEIRQAYRRFGKYLGLAFQAHDDYLGIWGDSALTGKSAESDLVTGKKSLPVVYGLNQNGPFARRWSQGKIEVQDVSMVAAMLEEEGARAYSETQVAELTQEAIQALERAEPQGKAGKALDELVEFLLVRTY